MKPGRPYPAICAGAPDTRRSWKPFSMRARCPPKRVSARDPNWSLTPQDVSTAFRLFFRALHKNLWVNRCHRICGSWARGLFCVPRLPVWSFLRLSYEGFLPPPHSPAPSERELRFPPQLNRASGNPPRRGGTEGRAAERRKGRRPPASHAKKTPCPFAGLDLCVMPSFCGCLL